MGSVGVLRVPSLEDIQGAGVWLQQHPGVALGLGVAGAGLIVHYGREMWITHKMTTIREAKTKQRDEDIKSWYQSNTQLSEQRESFILSLPLQDLISKLQDDSLKATEVLQAYQHAAYVAHQKTNCLVGPIWEAKALAEECDQSKQKKGPLHGVPISVKENYNVKGYDTCLCCPKFSHDPAEDDSTIVKVLRRLGAIPFVKTTVPHTMFSLDTCSHMFGQTNTPYDVTRTAGGSSGGEGALLAMKGTPFGLGGDVGGSIRVPCHFNGVYGIKPTSTRTSRKGIKGVWKGQNVVRSAYGPMTQDMDSLIAALRFYLHPEMFTVDKFMPPLPFRQQIFEEKNRLKIGYYSDNGLLACTPACHRAVMEAKQLLQTLGHELVELDVRAISKEANGLYCRVTCADKGESFLNATRGDKIGSSMKNTLRLITTSNTLKSVISLLYRPFTPSISEFVKTLSSCKSVYEWYELVDQVENFRTRVTEAWQRQGIEAIIGPGLACPAMKCGTPAKVGSLSAHMNLYNVLDYVVGSIPITKVTAEDEEGMKDYKVVDVWHKIVKESSERGTVGLPLSVQVVTFPWQEELCLRLMKEIDVALKA